MRSDTTLARSFALTWLLSLVAGAVHAADGPGDAKKKASAAEATAAATKWLDSLGDKGLVLAEKADDTGFVGRKIVGRSSTMFTYQKPGWQITLDFSSAIDPDTPLDDVRKRLKYVALDRLPTPGLEVPGWEIWPRTPTSSFHDGVEIVDFRDGQIQVHIRSGFFALYGRDPSVLVPADAPSPPDAYFMIRRRFGLDLKIEAPLSMEKPRGNQKRTTNGHS